MIFILLSPISLSSTVFHIQLTGISILKAYSSGKTQVIYFSMYFFCMFISTMLLYRRRPALIVFLALTTNIFQTTIIIPFIIHPFSRDVNAFIVLCSVILRPLFSLQATARSLLPVPPRLQTKSKQRDTADRRSRRVQHGREARR